MKLSKSMMEFFHLKIQPIAGIKYCVACVHRPSGRVAYVESLNCFVRHFRKSPRDYDDTEFFDYQLIRLYI